VSDKKNLGWGEKPMKVAKLRKSTAKKPNEVPEMSDCRQRGMKGVKGGRR